LWGLWWFERMKMIEERGERGVESRWVEWDEDAGFVF
jgi:hypothetical protein